MADARRVLVFAKTPYERTPYDRWLAGTGVEPLILTTAEFAEGYQHLANVHAFAEYDTNRLVDKAALHLARTHEVDAVFARAEADVVRAAQLRDLLDLPGQRTESALAFRDKVLMKDLLAGGPVELPHYRPLDSAFTAMTFIEKHGYPVVVKPVSESGSLGAAVIRDEAGLDAYLRRPWQGASEIETFVDGRMYHVDGLVVGGEVAFINPSRYVNDCLSFRSEEWLASVPLSAADPWHARLVEATRAVLDRLPTPRNTAFHTELWITPDDRVVFCEIASRTPGGMVAPMLEHCFGVELDRLWLLAECGLPVAVDPPRYRPAGGLMIPPSHGVLEYLPPTQGAPACVRDAVISGRVGQTFRGGVKSGLFLAGYVVTGETEDDVVENMERVVAWFDRVAVWRPIAARSEA